MTQSQFQVLRRLYAEVAAMADDLGSEATSPGLVIPSQCASFADARRAFLPDAVIPHPLGFETFVHSYCSRSRNPAVARFVELIRPFRPEAVYLASPAFDQFAHSRGAFLIALFFDATTAAGARFLVVFERVET